MKKALSLLLALFMLTSAIAAPTCAFAEDDTESPIIWMQTMQIIITDDKPLAESGDKVTIAVAATDNVAIDEFLILIVSPSGMTRKVMQMTAIENTDYFYVTLPVDDDTEPGYWSISQMKATDTSGHYMFISGLSEYSFGVKGSIFESDISFKNGTEYKYSPSAVEPEIVVTHNGKTLKEGTDYTVKYANNDNVGTATATVTGIGCFGGEHTKEFTIIPQTKFSVKVLNNTYAYNGKVKKPVITVYDGDGVVDPSNYTVSFATDRKSVGKHPITVTMNNNYSGEKTVNIVIKPQGTSITKLNAKGKSITATWNRQAVQTTGYQLQYSTDSSFKKGVKSKIIRNKTKTAVKSLTKGKKYYFRIRTYTKVNGQTFYSKWSKTKSKTVTK